MSSFDWTLGIKITPDGLVPCALNEGWTEIEGRAEVAHGIGIEAIYRTEFGGTHHGFARHFDADELEGALFHQVRALLEKHYATEIAHALSEPRQMEAAE